MTHDHQVRRYPRPLPRAGRGDGDGAPDDGLPPLDRRRFLQLMGASLALAGVVGCERQPPEEIVAYAHAPEDVVPGRPLYFATQLLLDGWAQGVLVESHMGRPTKVEGNPQHPASLGGTDVFAQADVLRLYDPSRSQTVRHGGEVSSWARLEAELAAWRDEARRRRGHGLRLLTGPTTSPTLLRGIAELQADLPGVRWHTHAAVGHTRTLAGARIALGEEVLPIYRVERAEVVLALDHDLLAGVPGAVRYARDFADGRRLRAPHLDMNRLYAVEPTPTVTGISADHRLALARAEVEPLLVSLAAALGVPLDPAHARAAAGRLPPEAREWVVPLARDLARARGRALVTVGEAQPPHVHALGHAVNEALGAGQTLEHVPTPTRLAGVEPGTLAELVRDIRGGAVEWLIIIDANPAYDAPAELDVGGALDAVPHRAHMGLYLDETAVRCPWHVPLSHPLETWGDARAYDLTAGVIQPLIAPLYRSRSAHELVAALAGRAQATAHELVRETWRGRHGDGDFEAWWRDVLRRGVVPGTAVTRPTCRVDLDAVRTALRTSGAPPAQVAAGIRPPSAPGQEGRPRASEELAGGLELVLQPDPRVWDGTHANNAWLLELPDPATKLVWDPVALVSVAMARQLGLDNEQVIELRLAGRTLEAPVFVLPGQAERSVTLRLGYGHRAMGALAAGLGYDAYRLRGAATPWAAAGLQVRRLDREHLLASSQHEDRQHDRHLARSGTLDDLLAGPARINETILRRYEPPEQLDTLFPAPPAGLKAPQWGMVIDLTACIGCATCTIACQAENNIPVVGKELARKGYVMHWIRVDRYFEGPVERPEVEVQPVPCMHCETAPCELVCPVGATQHSHDGLNEMIYNRCIGTRYCSNNCPYKVRRFNFLDYLKRSGQDTEVLALQRNPDVTVRALGVMEKCTYCVQRIRQAGIAAKKERRPIRDGEVVPACAGACPTRAITFGDIEAQGAQVRQDRDQPHHYGMLTELNTRPRTTYLARIRNKNPELPGEERSR